MLKFSRGKGSLQELLIKEDAMPDNLKKRGGRDRQRINTGESWEVSYWGRKLGLTAEKLRQYVKRFGNSAPKK
jgi:hypothetical protein